MSGFYDYFTNLENLALIASLWVGFGTLAIIPGINLIRKRQQRIKIEIEKQNIIKMRALIQEEIKSLQTKVDKMDHMINDLIIDIRVLEAIDNQEDDIKKDNLIRKKRNIRISEDP